MGLGTLGGLSFGYSPTGIVGALAVGGLVGLGASVGLTTGRRVPSAMPTMFVNGAVYGMLGSYILFEECDPCTNLPRVLLLGVLAGTAAGGLAAWLLDLTAGAAGAMSFGLYAGVLGPALALFSLLSNVSLNALGAATLLGATAGLVAGPFLDRWLHVSRNRWLAITGWSLEGAVVALLVSGFVHPGIPIASLLTLAGGIIGGGLGAAVTMEPDEAKAASPPAPTPAPPTHSHTQMPGVLITLAAGQF